MKTLTLILASTLGLPAMAATTLTFQVQGAISTQPAKINNNGDIAGVFQDVNLLWHGFRRYSNGTFQTFDVPGAISLSVGGLNDQGEIVGLYTTDNGLTYGGYMLSASGLVTTFAPPNSTNVQSASINNSGTIAGVFASCCSRVGYIMAVDGTFTTFNGPQGAELETVDAINDSGVIAGVIGLSVMFQRSSAGRYNLKVSGISGLVSNSVLHLGGMNASGVIVGSRDYGYGVPPYDTSSEYFTWDGTTLTAFLPGGAAYSGAATSINDSGVVVGFGYISRAIPSSAFIRTSDGTITTFSVGSVSTYPSSINNSGVICGSTVTSSSPNPVGFLYMP